MDLKMVVCIHLYDQIQFIDPDTNNKVEMSFLNFLNQYASRITETSLGSLFPITSFEYEINFKKL